MGDLVMGKRWNTEDSLEMALGVRRALESVLRKEDPPSKCRSHLNKGITFLDEAKGGEALISGLSEEANSFNGTFLPLCLATDVRIRFVGEAASKNEDKKIGELLSSYKNALLQIKEKAAQSKIEPEIIKEMAGFFEVLSKVLLQQADPMMKEYSQPHSYAESYV